MRLQLLVFCLLIVYTTARIKNFDQRQEWKWTCEHRGKCVKDRIVYKEQNINEKKEVIQSLGECVSSCTTHANLWPKPTKNTRIGKDFVQVNLNSIDVVVNGVPQDSKAAGLAKQAGKRFKDLLITHTKSLPGPFQSGGRSFIVQLRIDESETEDLTLDTDESYNLRVVEDSDGRINATIIAPNFFGARHGLETLSQLVFHDDNSNAYKISKDVQISDAPKFSYRGILLDTSRNYISAPAIKRTIDAMAANKLNTFHWHITDSQSFPFVAPSNPTLSRLGAYSKHKVYTPEVIKEIVQYAKVRGVRVLPEFDAPAHVGEGWQDTDFVACFNAQPWSTYCVEPPCGQFDPTKKGLYDALEGIYGDMLDIFKPDIFHMGGDEVSTSCWNSTADIVSWMATERGWGRKEEDFMNLWDEFQTQALDRLNKKAGKKLPIIMWTSTLTKPAYVEKYLPKDTYIIQIWTTGKDPTVKFLLDKGYRLILSNYDALYMDCGFGGWVADGNNWCSPYIPWQKIYDNSPLAIAGDKVRQVLGNEAALWTEQVDDSSLDGRLWPRAAAMAERLWSDPEESWKSAEDRMLVQRERLVQMGIAAEMLEPEWCRHHQGQCPV